jgi:hypothetical protein
MIRRIFVSPLKEPVPTLEKWTESVTETIIADLAEDIHSMSVIEMGGLRKCGITKEENYVITITDKGFIISERAEEMGVEVVKPEKIEEKLPEEIEVKVKPKVPAYILGQIEVLEERYKEAESVDEKMAIREEINKLKERYGIV